MNLTASIGGKKGSFARRTRREHCNATKEMTDVKAIAARTYDAVADPCDAPALSFWDRIGRRTVQQLSPQLGARVLDACCGRGASAILAALAVGTNGRVLSVDLTENLLRLGRSKDAQLGLRVALGVSAWRY
jgi:ubiquinone/menaquinone biosynthesis C-methylase UbiE